MYKKSVFVLLVLCSIGLFYSALKNNDSWVVNDSPRGKSPYDFSEAELLKLIYKDLKRVNYAAIVYPIAQKTYHNSWFNRKMEEYFHWHGATSIAIRADVEYTIFGEEFNAIEFGAADDSLTNFPLLVMLCASGENMYEPDLGYVKPASQKLIEHLKKVDPSIFKSKESNICP